jgi:hypothetical protein
MYTCRLPRPDFQRQLMGRRDIGRPRRRWKEQDNSSFKGTDSRTSGLDTFVMVAVMKRVKALDMLHPECHESVGFCFIGYQSNIVCLDLSSLRDFGNTRLRYDREFMKHELLMTSLTACGSWSAASQGMVTPRHPWC